jgi:manganese/zinc/iron transport system permease protein
MSSSQLEIQLIGSAVAAACALPGVFLVLRRMALLTDAITHAVLLGIVLAFFVTKDVTSPFLLLAAAGTGVLTAALVELITNTRLLREDAAIGLVFPVLFSIGVILISRFAGNVHLDSDAVLLGELAFAPFQRFTLGGHDLGPKALWVMGTILVVNVLFIGLLFKELKLATFDPALARVMGFSPVALHYAFTGIVSATAVGSFDAVGSILVVALMIAPAAAAYLMTTDLLRMLLLAVGFGVASAIIGYWGAHAIDVSIAGSMATAAGVIFALVYLFAPARGLLATTVRRRVQRDSFARAMLAIHLFQHEGGPDEERECRLDHLSEHLQWPARSAKRIVARAVRTGFVTTRGDGGLALTDSGRRLAQEALVQ